MFLQNDYIITQLFACFIAQSEMSSECHLNHVRLYQKQMNVNLATLFSVGCCIKAVHKLNAAIC